MHVLAFLECRNFSNKWKIMHLVTLSMKSIANWQLYVLFSVNDGLGC